MHSYLESLETCCLVTALLEFIFILTGIVKRLLKAGSPINYKDCGECTPLFHAIYSHQTDVADLLIKGK